MAGRQLLIDAAIILALLLVALIGYKLSPYFLPQADLTATAESACDLNRQACAATLPDGRRVTLEISPRPIPTVQALRVDVAVSGINARKVEVDFAGADMNMGYNRQSLTATSAGRYGGAAALPVCVTGRMAWRATVLVDTERGRIAAPFVFNTPP